MKNLLHHIKWILTIMSIIIGILFGIEWINRLLLPYNSEGRYFDQVTEIVYTDSGIIVYGLLTLIFLIIGTVFLFLKLRSPK
ncbi:MAG: hypothetical protein KAT68_14035 [Bacteroidales bacterium]|nr:hypothetical protein [Bacteroidales bacterium]